MLPIVILLTRVRTLVMELPNHLASHLEIEVGIEPTFAVLQTDAYSSIDNSTLAQSGGVEPPSSDLESEALTTKTKTVLKWHSHSDSN